MNFLNWGSVVNLRACADVGNLMFVFTTVLCCCSTSDNQDLSGNKQKRCGYGFCHRQHTLPSIHQSSLGFCWPSVTFTNKMLLKQNNTLKEVSQLDYLLYLSRRHSKNFSCTVFLILPTLSCCYCYCNSCTYVKTMTNSKFVLVSSPSRKPLAYTDRCRNHQENCITPTEE